MSDLINIALNKKACQSSTSRWSKPEEACSAVNGTKTGDFSFHTDIETNAWWQVDLETVFHLSKIVVYNRDLQGSPLGDRATSMAIFASVDGMSWEKLYPGGIPFGGLRDNKPLAVDCSGKRARFVRLQLQDKNYLHLDEVEIYTRNARLGNHASSASATSSLVSLGSRYGTDKVPHGFCDVYERSFAEMRPRVTKILEIGVFFGASLCMWRDWFPNAIVHGADHFTGQQGNGMFFENADKFRREVLAGVHPRIVLHQLDQSRRDDLEQFASRHLYGTFDLIIDDASHLMLDQQQTLGALFRLVKPGGYFVIEDLHSSLCLDYDVEPDGSNSTLLMIQRALAGHGWQSRYMRRQEMDFLDQAIDLSQTKIFASDGSQTCVIRRRMSPVPDRHLSAVPGSVVIINYASMDELNQERQQQHISWARQWAQESSSRPDCGIVSAEVLCFGPDALDAEFYSRNLAILSQKRGGGFWLWKPYILEAMLAATNAEFVVYCDCGSTVIQSLAAVVGSLRDSGASLLAFDMTSNGWFEYQWTKGQVLRAMGATDPVMCQSGQLGCTVSAWKVNDISRKLVHEWLLLMQNTVFATDAESADGGGDYPGFVEHRHDQSVFSLLVKKLLLSGGWNPPAVITKEFRSWVGHHHIS